MNSTLVRPSVREFTMESSETTENANAFEQQYDKSSYTGDPDTMKSANETVVDPCSNDQNDVNPTAVRFVDSETAEHTADQFRLQDQPQCFTAVDLSLDSNSKSKTNNKTTTPHAKGSAFHTSQFSNRHHQPSAVMGSSLNSKLQSSTNDKMVFRPNRKKRKYNFNQFSNNHQPYAAVDLSSNSNIKSMMNDNTVVPYYNRSTNTSNTDQRPGYYQHKQGSWLHFNKKSYKKKRYNSYFRKNVSYTNHRNFNNFNEFQTTASKFDSERTSDLMTNAGDLDKLNKMTAKDFDDDRYARFGIHEYEIKDYVRTITYINCIEHCAENHFKVNINLINLKIVINGLCIYH